MKKYIFSFAALVLLVSCVREKEAPSVREGKYVEFTVGIDTKTALGEKVGNTYPNLWSAGDVISVNGVESIPLGDEYDGASSAVFSVLEVEAPYHAVYPASALSDYSDGDATFVVPSEQTWKSNTYDPAAFLVTTVTNNTSLAFGAQVSMLKVTPKAADGVMIRSIKLIAADESAALSGEFTSDFESLSPVQGGSSRSVTMSSATGVPAGEPWIICFAPTDFTGAGFDLVITDTEGGRMVKSVNPGKPYVAGKIYSGEVDFVPEPFFNVHGTVTCSGEPVPDVLISDGVNIVKTDAAGQYKMNSEKKWHYVFVTIPSGYEVPLQGVLPEHYKELSEDTETPEQVNFELVKVNNDDFTLFVFGDIHLARRTGDLAQFEKVATFARSYMDQAPGKVYVLTLGDMTWDMYWIANNYSFGDYIQTVNQYFSGIPFFHTMGNHDNEMEVADDFPKALKYTENIAPDYYSFNLGKIHFIVLDNMDFTGVQSGEENRSKYAKNFTAEQLEWLRQDLSYVDKSTPIFVTAHEPLARPSGLSWGEELNGADADLNEFIGIFDGYNVRFLSGHTHNTFFRRYSPTFVEHNSGAICASWWWSGYINPGIHIAQDGAPGGFTIWNISDTNCTHYYQAALQSPEYQFRAYDMNEVKATITADLSEHSGYPKYYNHIQSYGDNEILVNVWDYDEDWSVEISENGTPLEVSEVGVYDPLHIYAMTIPRLNKYNTTTFSTAKWRHFFKATASAANTPVTVKVTDRYGNVFTEEMTRPKAFTMDDYKNEVQYQKPEAEFYSSTSSTVVFGWTVGGTAAEDAALPYKLELFRDSACSDLVVSYDVPAGHSCWDGNALRFVFGGLQPSTTYYFKVHNTQNGDSSDVVSGTTDPFTVVDPDSVANAGVGDVILAEDFSEIAWGPEIYSTAAGFFPSEKTLEPVTGTEHSGSFVEYESTSRRLYSDTKVTSDKRLYNWGFFGNSSVYAGNGFVRVGTTQTETARTHIVTPALSGIPAGKIATVDVTVTCCMMDKSNDVGVFVADHSGLSLTLAPDQSSSTSPSFSSSGGKYTGASLTNGVALDVPYRSLATKTVRLEGLNSNSCLLIGSIEHVSKKNRFWLSDVKVQIVSLEDTPSVAASMEKSTSCSLTFTWTEGEGAAADIAKPWTIALYRDAACTDLVVSHNIAADSEKWSSRQPRFIFGGLDPDTDYWFKATDTTEGNVKVSKVVKGTTQSFTRVDATKVSNAGVGDVILAEDFSETYGPDEWDGAAGYMPSQSIRSLDPPSGEDPNGSIEAYNSTGTRFWGNYVQMTEGRRLANGWGFFGNSSVYSRSGYLRVSVTTSGARTHIVTPRLAGIPDGMKATVSVTVTALQHEKASDVDVAVFFSDDCTMYTGVGISEAKFCKYKIAGSDKTLPDNGQALGLANTTQKTWYTRTIEISGVSNQSHLIIGSLNNVSGKTRFNLADVVVKITALEDANRTVKVSILGDSISTFNGWCDKSNIPSGKSSTMYYPKSDGDVLDVGDTWWYKLIYNKMEHGTFEKNISAGNTTVVQNTTGDSSAYWYGWDFGTRLQAQGLGNPDVVCIFGGTNDLGHLEYNDTSEELIDGVEMNAGSFPASSQSRLEELYAAASAATTVAEADALDGTTFCSAYIRLLQMIKMRHPAAKVVCVIGDYLYYGQGQAISRIAELFGEDFVRPVDILSKYGYKANSAIPKYSYAHPTAAGMSKIANEIYMEVGEWIDEQ